MMFCCVVSPVFLAQSGLAYSTAHKFLFCLRAATADVGVEDPKPFSRFAKLVLKGYHAVVIPWSPALSSRFPCVCFVPANCWQTFSATACPFLAGSLAISITT